MADLTCVGALIRDDRHRVFVQRRSVSRQLLPGIWDFVGGHVEPGEHLEQALAREIAEETGWRLRRIEAVIADWSWEVDGTVRHELDYLVEVDGDLAAPRLEAGKHDACTWVGPEDVELMMEGRTDGDRRMRDIVAKAARIRLTDRLRLEPLGHEHLDDLVALHDDPAVAAWYEGPWSDTRARNRIVRAVAAWEDDGVDRWIAYDRSRGTLVGRGGLAWADVEGSRRLEIGWTVRGDLWGHGYATEIGQAGLAFAFDHLEADEVVGFAEPHNERSRAVMTRLGMRHAREIRHADRPMVLYTARREQAGDLHRSSAAKLRT